MSVFRPIFARSSVGRDCSHHLRGSPHVPVAPPGRTARPAQRAGIRSAEASRPSRPIPASGRNSPSSALLIGSRSSGASGCPTSSDQWARPRPRDRRAPLPWCVTWWVAFRVACSRCWVRRLRPTKPPATITTNTTAITIQINTGAPFRMSCVPAETTHGIRADGMFNLSRCYPPGSLGHRSGGRHR
jgi:hypothetical protein